MALLDTTKLLYTALGVGVVGGSGAGAYYYLSNSDSKEKSDSITPKNEKTDIATKLSKEKYQLLESSSREWTKILVAYKENTKLHFEGFDGKTPPTGAEEKLKELCNEATKLDSSEDANNAIYEKAKKWCTQPRTLTDILQDKGYNMLDTSADGDPDTEAWNTKLKSHEGETTHSDKKFTALNLTQNGVANAENRTKLRTKCKGLKDQNRKHYEQEFEKELDQAMLWCATNS